MEYLLGIEIGGKVIRSAVVTAGSKKIQAYAQYTREAKEFDQEPQLDELTQAFTHLFETLPDKYVKNAHVAVAFGSKNCGVRPGISSDPWFGALEIRLSTPISRLEEEGTTVFAPKRLIRNINKAAQTTGIEIHVLELAPLTTLAILPKDFTGSFTLRSGTLWNVTVDNGAPIEALEIKSGYSEHKMALGPQAMPLEDLGPVTVNPQLLETYDLAINDLAVVSAAALTAGLDVQLADDEIIRDTIPPLPDAAMYSHVWGEHPHAASKNPTSKAFLITLCALLIAAGIFAGGYYFIAN